MGAIRTALLDLMREFALVQVQQGKVVSVDLQSRTCEVDPQDGRANYVDVRLQAVGDMSTGMLLIPKVGSIVLFGIIENDKAATFIIEPSELDGIQLNGDQFKGLLKHDEVKGALDKINGNVTSLKNAALAIATALDALVPGTSAAYQTATATVADANTSNLKNDNVTHG